MCVLMQKKSKVQAISFVCTTININHSLYMYTNVVCLGDKHFTDWNFREWMYVEDWDLFGLNLEYSTAKSLDNRIIWGFFSTHLYVLSTALWAGLGDPFSPGSDRAGWGARGGSHRPHPPRNPQSTSTTS